VKLQRLDHGSMTVQEYYQELQKGMLRCGIVEDTKDKMAHFYGGLRSEIQDIIDYKEYTTVNCLFELTMLAEKELQGRHRSRSNVGSTFMPRTTTGQARTAPSPSLRPSVSPPLMTTQPTAMTSTTRTANNGKTTVAAPAKSASSVSSTCRTSGIHCHKCQGVGHMKKNCPSQWAYIATDDGGYISTSDVEDEIDNTEVHGEEDDIEDTAFSAEDTMAYQAIIVQRVLSAQMKQAEQQQCHNLFQTFFIINNRRARIIIDSGSCNNLVSSDLVKKLGLTTCPHPHPYHIQWLNDSGKAKVTQTVQVHFSIGTYFDFADCDVVPMQACSLLLGHPWEYDIDALHHGRSNKYTFMHKGK
jgi:hypothetical protein